MTRVPDSGIPLASESGRHRDLLDTVARAVLSDRPLASVVRESVTLLAAHLDGLRATYATVTDDGGLRVTQGCGPDGWPALEGRFIDLAVLPSGQTAQSASSPILIEDARRLPAQSPARERLEEEGIGALLAVPVRRYEHNHAWLVLDAPSPRAFGPDQTEVLEEVARLLGLAAAADAAQRGRRLAEEQRRRTEEVYRTLVETSPDAILLLDLSANIVLANRQAAWMYDPQAPAPLEGRNALDFVAPEDRLRAARNVRATIHRGNLWGVAYALLRRDGSRLPAEVSTSVVADAGGTAVGLIVIVRDATERRRNEERQAELQAALRKAALEWRQTFDAIESPVLILDREGNIMRLNRAAKSLAGRTFHEIVRRPLRDLGEGQPWTAAGQLLARMVSERASAGLHVTDAATGRTWDLTGSLSGGQEGTAERVIVVARDVTRTVELQASLRRSETMSALGALVAGVAHEVRNPLHGVTATLDAFEARYGTREEHSRYLRVLRGELDRINQLMQDLLAYGRPAAPEREPTPLASLVTSALRSCGPLARRHKVRLLSLVDESLAPLHMDRARLLAALRNLVENAVQHAPSGSTVTVEAQEIDVDGNGRRGVACSVLDEGPGFRAEDLPHVFSPFFTRRRGGTGLGLSIVHRIVEQHGGEVRAQTRPEGGAAVTLVLPRD